MFLQTGASPKRGKLSGSTYPVQTNNVIVSFFGVEFNGESTRVASLVWKLSAWSDGGETDEDWSLLADLGEEVCFLFTSMSASDRVKPRRGGMRGMRSIV